ncbi:hypothetical protein DPMN_063330 [Dreissena polymorpha]|uniref:Uncharacterized protein n=1 Tax=Dreissena polymorpha TaxID=45954 RepID=A0A9D4CAB2_DREPO|nr:hypothetical protein DPMN_063330 [Dreissena polymorpha]
MKREDNPYRLNFEVSCCGLTGLQGCFESGRALTGDPHPPQDSGRHPVGSPELRVLQGCGLNPDWSTPASH